MEFFLFRKIEITFVRFFHVPKLNTIFFSIRLISYYIITHYLPFEMELLFIASNGVNVSRIIRRGRTGTAIKSTNVENKI